MKNDHGVGDVNDRGHGLDERAELLLNITEQENLQEFNTSEYTFTPSI